MDGKQFEVRIRSITIALPKCYANGFISLSVTSLLKYMCRYVNVYAEVKLSEGYSL